MCGTTVEWEWLNDVRVEQVERPLIMVEPRTSWNQESAVEWLRTGPSKCAASRRDNLEDAYAEAASDWLQVIKESSADEELRFDVVLHVISAKRL